MKNFTARKIKKYGWIPDLPDARDRKFLAPNNFLTRLTLPSSVDLRAKMPAIYDQGELGSCTANAVSGICQYTEMNEGAVAKQPVVQPSRLFVYFNTRVLEGTWQTDSGASISDTMKSINKWGYAPEALWPYNIAKFNIPPVIPAYAKAWWYKTINYLSVQQDAIQLKSALSLGYPIAFGFTVYDSFESQAVANTGIVPMPNINKENVLGGHAVILCGYDDSKNWFIVRNSWGTSWGAAGYCYMPYTYILDADLASDFWLVKTTP